MILNCGVGEDSWESLGQLGDRTSPSWRKSLLNNHWKDWCWSWNSNTLANSCNEPDSLEKILMPGKTDGRKKREWQRMRWLDGITDWTWVWANSRSWWWTGWPGMLHSMGSQRVRHNLVSEQQQKLSNTSIIKIPNNASLCFLMHSLVKHLVLSKI